MLLMIDNYDSFTFNLVQYFGELGEDVRVFRNDPSCSLHIQHLVLDDAGADRDGDVHVARVAQVAAGPAVQPALGGL